MSIIKVVKQHGRFLVADVEVFEDQSLSFGARGLMAYLLTKPDNWEVRRDQLINASPAGKVAIQRMINELKEAGYMRRYQENDPETGKFVTVTDVYETKALNPDLSSQTPIYGGTKPTVTTKPVHGANGSFKNLEADLAALPENAYQEPDYATINSMISVLAGTCKGFANYMLEDKCPFYQTAVILIENGITEQDVMDFREWWEENRYYEGKPSLTTLKDEIENSIRGVVKKNRGTNHELTKAISEIDMFLGHKIQFGDLGEHTQAAIRAMGLSTIKSIGPGNRKTILRQFEDEFNKSRNS